MRDVVTRSGCSKLVGRWRKGGNRYWRELVAVRDLRDRDAVGRTERSTRLKDARGKSRSFPVCLGALPCSPMLLFIRLLPWIADRKTPRSGLFIIATCNIAASLSHNIFPFLFFFFYLHKTWTFKDIKWRNLYFLQFLSSCFFVNLVWSWDFSFCAVF